MNDEGKGSKGGPRIPPMPQLAPVAANLAAGGTIGGTVARAMLVVLAMVGLAWLAWVLRVELMLGVPFPVAMGLLAFLTEMIPPLGPWLAGVPIAILAFSISPITGLLMVLWMLAIQALESYALVPWIHSRVTATAPLTVLLAVLAGETIAGIVGAILAVPLVGVGYIVVESVILPLRRADFGSG